jgi:beta-galactosidase
MSSARPLLTLLLLLLAKAALPLSSQAAPTAGREHLLMDFNWRFAYGHPFDPKQDFNNGLGYFSYLAKTGYGDGAAAANFDDRAWRQLDLPHDWAVEQPLAGRFRMLVWAGTASPLRCQLPT